MKEINLLWADRDHPDIFKWSFILLERKNLIKTETAGSQHKWEEEILEKSCGKDVLLIHRGLMTPEATVKLLKKVKHTEPNIKIALLANAKHPALEDIVDFYVPIPIDEEKLYRLIEENID